MIENSAEPVVKGAKPENVPVAPLHNTREVAKRRAHAVDVSFQLVMPEEFPLLNPVVRSVLTRELGVKEADRIANLIKEEGGTRCAGGWLPTDVALNLTNQIATLPLATMQAMVQTASGPERGPQRDSLVKDALEKDVEYIFIQDSDVLQPANAFAMLKGVMDEHSLDICAGVYFTKTSPCQPLIGIGPDLPFWDGWYEDRWKVWECTLVGNGCLLVRSDVFRNIEPPWFLDVAELHPDAPPTSMTDDAHFCRKAMDAGYKIHCYTGVTCGHLDIHKGVVYGFDPEKKRPAWRRLRGTWQPFVGDVVPLEEGGDNGNALGHQAAG